MSFLDTLAAWLAKIFGAPTQDGGASVPTSTAIYPDKANPGPLTTDAPVNYPDPLQLLSFGLYGQDVSGTPNYPSSAVSGQPAGTSWQDRVDSFLNSLGGGFLPAPVSPVNPITNATFPGAPPVTGGGSGGTDGGTTHTPVVILDPGPPPSPPTIASYGGNSGGSFQISTHNAPNIQ